MAESINGFYKSEVIHRNHTEVELATLAWMDWRLLERLGHILPAEAEQAYYVSIVNGDLAI